MKNFFSKLISRFRHRKKTYTSDTLLLAVLVSSKTRTCKIWKNLSFDERVKAIKKASLIQKVSLFGCIEPEYLCLFSFCMSFVEFSKVYSTLDFRKQLTFWKKDILPPNFQVSLWVSLSLESRLELWRVFSLSMQIDLWKNLPDRLKADCWNELSFMERKNLFNSLDYFERSHLTDLLINSQQKSISKSY